MTDQEVADLAEIEEAVEDSVEEAEALEAEEAEEEASEKEDLLKCMTLPVLSATKNARSHSGQQETSQFYAVIASEMKVAQVLVQAQGLVQEEMDLLLQARECLRSNSSKLMQNSIKF